jgi:ABC-type protease/lipase transport system fused ATPase/permease subunit
MVSYSIAMALRILCLFLCFVFQGWWVLIPAAGVVVLPAVAVMLANITRAPGAQKGAASRPNLSSLTSGLK